MRDHDVRLAFGRVRAFHQCSLATKRVLSLVVVPGMKILIHITVHMAVLREVASHTIARVHVQYNLHDILVLPRGSQRIDNLPLGRMKLRPYQSQSNHELRKEDQRREYSVVAGVVVDNTNTNHVLLTLVRNSLCLAVESRILRQRFASRNEEQHLANA